MSNETIKEIVKSFAYGYTPEKVAEVYEITEAEATELQKKYAEAIEEKEKYLKEQGWT